MKENFYKILWYHKQFLFLVILTLSFGKSFSQQNSGIIKGNISDVSGILPGASVSIAGTTNGTIADEKGNYSIKLAPGIYALTASFTGYTKNLVSNVKVVAGKEMVVNFILTTNNLLQEVNISYGTQSRRNITGSIAELKTKNLSDQPMQQFAQELQGQVAGVNVIQSNGAPGRGFDFRIRGAASLSFSNAPLFVVDGLPVTGGINNINPDEIETFTILKDASASALYGSRASNGVILITTKHAKAGEAYIDFNANYGVQVVPLGSRLKLMNATQFATFENEYYQDKLLYEPATKPVLDPVYANPERYGEGTDWFKVLTRKAPIQSYNITVATAREHSSSTVIAGYSEQQGTVVNTFVRQFNFRINQDFATANNKLKTGFNLATTYHIDHNTQSSIATEGVSGLIEQISEASPLIAPVNPDGSYPLSVATPGQVANINPLARAMLTVDNYNTTRILGNGYLNYELYKGLILKTNLGVDKSTITRQNFVPASITTANIATGLASSNDNYSWTAEAYLNYNKSFGDHHLEGLVGYSAQEYNQYTSSTSGSTFPSDAIPYLNAASIITAGTSGTSAYTLLSTIARLNYSFKGKYLLQGAIRRDGSSRFGEDDQYGTFPSVSAGWIISDEQFMERYNKILNYFKVRASLGVTGNNNFGSNTANYPSLAQIGSGNAYNYTFNDVLQAGGINSTLGNTQLRWERNKQFDIGADFSLLNNRLSITYDYYHKTTDGLIQARQLPGSSGFASIQYNIGAFEFWGHEITINTTNTTGKLKWNSSFNISFDRNLVTNLVAPGFTTLSTSLSADYTHNAIGHPLGLFYGFVFDGLYKDDADVANSPKETLGVSAPGTVKFKDVNGDGIIDVNDRTFIGNPHPKFKYGFNNNLKYKNLDFNLSLAGSYGGQILTYAKYAYTANLDGARGGLLAAVADRWRSPTNPGAGVFPRTLTGSTALQRYSESQWVESGSYLSCKNVNLGYTIPISTQSKAVIKSIRVYASVSNAFIITKYDGPNPEVSVSGLNGTSEGVDQNGYPVARTFSLGLSTRFK